MKPDTSWTFEPLVSDKRWAHWLSYMYLCVHERPQPTFSPSWQPWTTRKPRSRWAISKLPGPSGRWQKWAVFARNEVRLGSLQKSDVNEKGSRDPLVSCSGRWGIAHRSDWWGMSGEEGLCLTHSFGHTAQNRGIPCSRQYWWTKALVSIYIKFPDKCIPDHRLQ